MSDRFCVACGTERRPQAKFCANCGHRFDGDAVAAPKNAPLTVPPPIVPNTPLPAQPAGSLFAAAAPTSDLHMPSAFGGAAVTAVAAALIWWLLIDTHLIFGRSMTGPFVYSIIVGVACGFGTVLFAGGRGLPVQVLAAASTVLAIFIGYMLEFGDVVRYLSLSVGIWILALLALATISAAAVAWDGWARLMRSGAR